MTFGDYGIQALEPGWITNRQIEAARIAMTRYIKRGGKVWINIFPDKPVTQKPAETRMGSGKGNPEHWVAVVKPGRVMFELSGVPEPTAREAMRLAMHKLPIKTRFVVRQERGMSDGEPKQQSCASSTTPSWSSGWGRRRRSFQPPLPERHRCSSTTSRASAQVRRDVARIETLLREREIAAAEQLEAQE